MDGFAQRPSWPDDGAVLRQAVGEWIERHHDPGATVRQWWKDLAGAGLTAPTWPRSHGGLGATTRVQEVVERALAEAGCIAPPVDNESFRAIAPALRHFLALEHLPEVLQPILEGSHRWALLADDAGKSEVRIERDWKYITLFGDRVDVDPLATHAIVVVRADPASEGTKGLTCFLLDLDEEPITREGGVVHLDGHRLLPERVLGRELAGREVVAFVRPYLERSLAGRIRRGLVHVPCGELAGALDLTLTEARSVYAPPPPPPGTDRRQR
jgi:alkylation response protein AidB-like acyl-CoA dehydrogenase